MVFSFFKKQPDKKMPEREAVRPRPPAATPGPKPSAESIAKPAAPGPSGSDLDFTDFSDFDITGIEIEQDLDPVHADIEQAAVLFANGQDSAARAVLEAAARGHSGEQAERLWRMLLDLVQVLGDRPTFDRLGEEFARTCETSPPTWRVIEKKAASTAGPGEKEVVLQGVVAGADAPEFQQLRAAMQKKEALRLDIGKLASCDEAAAESLLDMLKQARQQAVPLSLEGAEGLIGRLNRRLVVGQPESIASWLLLLELYLRQGDQEAFEEKAVDYAVTFEVSPPSWEQFKPVAAKKPTPTLVAPALEDDAQYLSGELKNHRFEELQEYLAGHSQIILDFSQVKRLDFFSAGILRNLLDPCRREGKEVTIRDPHHLVAELMALVDLPSVARIVVRKY